ncbi:MAG TPA: class I SAM-dependent methyltransferase [Terriglobia bacterium]|nr:class I SAM-dependent methyltransferase [Terriglobia bacterium]
MLLTSRHESAKVVAPSEAKMPSHGMEWLWQQLRDVRRPLILDCGPLRQTTLDVLLRRGVKLCVADIVSPLQRNNPKFWDKTKKVPVFLTETLLEQIPKIETGSQDAVFCWHLLDLIPPEAVAPVVERLFAYLKPGGILFALLRQPYLADGLETVCWLEDLICIHTDSNGKKPFAYPVVNNREIEKLLPAGGVKIFLTRSGRREVVALR